MENELQVFALGGLGEVGKNCYVFESKKDIIVVDCGSKFINNSGGLVSASIPNFSHLINNRLKIRGIFVTHAHDDHLSAIPFILREIPEIPLYGSEFTISLAKQKTRIKSSKKWNIFRDETTIVVGEFKISFFRVTHSIPGSYGLFIEFLPKNVKIIVTGDFKFDWTQIGEKFDLRRLTEYSKKGIDLLLSESTNAEIEGSTPSESKVIKRLESIITFANGRVIITSFSSNVYRLKKIMEIAKKTDRRIVLLGTSLLKAMKAIRSVSLWELDSSVFLKASDICKVSPNKLIIFCTGSQGEERSVLNRLANNIYPGWKIEKNDTVIFTSSPIMDNKANVELINNKLFSNGAIVYENNPSDLLHASGHACQEDLKLLLNIVSPRFFFPCHGEHYMLKKHSLLAEEVGIPRERTFVCQNGDIVSFKDGIFFLDKKKIDVEPTYILEDKIVPSQFIKEKIDARNIMGEGGVVSIIIFYEKKEGKMHFDYPCIFTYGFLNVQKNKKLIESWRKKIKEYLDNAKELNKEKVYNFVSEKLLEEFSQEKPMIKIMDFDRE